jgi:transcriptional regulator with XRE-family HTH domain
MPQSIGEFIRQLRERQGMSQQELAGQIDYAREMVSRWERGVSRPSIEALPILVQALKATNEDFYYMLGLMKILQPTRFPPYEKTIALLERLADYVSRLNVPSYILDYRGRFWVVNQAVAEMTGLDMSLLSQLMREIPLADGRCDLIDYMQVVFNHHLPFRASLTNWERLARNQIARFKMINLYRRHEPFYAEYVERARKRLPPEDFAAFETLWNSTEPDHVVEGNDLIDLLTTEVVYRSASGLVQRYTLRAERVFPYLNLFDQIMYVPEGTPVQLTESSRPVLCLWKVLPNLKTILADEWL